MEQTANEHQRISDYRRRWVVAVGVRDYTGGIKPLKNAVNDACLTYRILTTDYGFTGRLLCRTVDVEEFDREFRDARYSGLAIETTRNGSLTDIIDVIDEIAKKAEPEDLFVFFYAGHGTDEGRGYMVPHGAVWENHATYLMYEEFFGALSSLPCRHKILFFECCFAGITTRNTQDISVMTELAKVQGDGRDIGEMPSEEHNAGELPHPSSTQPVYDIVLGDLIVAIAATFSFAKTPDAFQDYDVDGRRSKNSAFTYALAECLEKLDPGRSLIPEGIFYHIFTRVTQDLLRDSDVQPRMATYGSGGGSILLSKPALQITTKNIIHIEKDVSSNRHIESLAVKGGNRP